MVMNFVFHCKKTKGLEPIKTYRICQKENGMSFFTIGRIFLNI